MDKQFWDTIGLILVASNALGILVLFEMFFFKFPFITVFIFLYYAVYKLNQKVFKYKPKLKPKKA